MWSRSDSTSELASAACWLVRDGVVLASVEVPIGRRARSRGLLCRPSFEGAMLIEPARSVHTFGMKFPLDIALLDERGAVIKTLRLRRFRVSAPIWRARSVLEAQAGAFGTWGLKIGDVLEIRESNE